MKKYIIFVMAILMILLCSCSNDGNSNTQPTASQPTQDYHIDDLFLETNIEELMKQHADHTYYEGEDGNALLSIPSTLGTINGVYDYSIINGEITERKFTTEESFYTDPKIVWGYYDPEKLPNTKDNQGAVDNKIDEMYRILTEDYGLTTIHVTYEKTNTSEMVDHPAINTREEFRECMLPLYNGIDSEYGIVTFSGFGENNCVSLTVFNNFFSLAFEVEIK